MSAPHLVFGLLNTSAALADPTLASRLRSFTISWSRHGYLGPIIEETSVDGILRQAAEQGYRYCLIQAYGHVIVEPWIPAHANAKDFHQTLSEWVEHNDFFVAGHLLVKPGGVFGLDRRCLLVDLDCYRGFGCPPFDRTCKGPSPRVAVTCATAADGERLASIKPTGNSVTLKPVAPGWNFIFTSLQHKKTVYGYPAEMLERTLDLDSRNPNFNATFAGFLGQRIAAYDPDGDQALSRDQRRFLQMVHV